MSEPDCPFCNIATQWPPSDNPSGDYESISPSAFVVLSTPLVMAFLDIMPLSPGHILITTRKHRSKISDVTDLEARELGSYVSLLSRALANVTGTWDWNIVQNNGAAASQVVPHVHYHLIPRPKLNGEERNKSFTMFGKGMRSELRDEEAAELAEKLRREVGRERGTMERQRSKL
ncbi:related to histidine triad protein [Rhynchosporium secalis]|uniref:Related to histidine triad protein n=1 Tax=Rhynchosporium secalis TaxID=38038 RepID=A0A1E1LY98_RHYSE|nr:related to histidine triad protein [Rhynchosporium secalis]